MRGQHNIAVKTCLRILELMLINSGVQMVNISYFGLNICVCVLLPIYMSILFNFLSYSDFLMSSQHVLERGKPQERSQILSKLSGHIVQLSQHKFASNVVEKCLEYGDATERELLVAEIFGHDDQCDNLLVSLKLGRQITL